MRAVMIFCVGFTCGLIFFAVLQRRYPATGSLAASSARDLSQPNIQRGVMPEETREGSADRLKSPVAVIPERGVAPADEFLMHRQLMIPVEGVRADSLRYNFNEARGGHRHEALDIMAARNTPVLAADSGRVAKLFQSKAGGITVYQFDPTETYCYYYAHLDHYASGLKEGMVLRKGDILGYVGSTGNASSDAPHLHFTIFRLGPEKHWWQGTAIDPYEFLKRSSG